MEFNSLCATNDIEIALTTTTTLLNFSGNGHSEKHYRNFSGS